MLDVCHLENLVDPTFAKRLVSSIRRSQNLLFRRSGDRETPYFVDPTVPKSVISSIRRSRNPLFRQQNQYFISKSRHPAVPSPGGPGGLLAASWLPPGGVELHGRFVSQPLEPRASGRRTFVMTKGQEIASNLNLRIFRQKVITINDWHRHLNRHHDNDYR